MTVSSIQVQVHQDDSDLMNLRHEWKDLLERSTTNTLFQAWQWNQLWWKHFGRPGELFLMTVRSNHGELIGIAPFFCDLNEKKRKRLQFIGGTDLSDYLDFIVWQGKEPLFYSAVSEFLNSHPKLWEVLDLHCLPAHSPTLHGFIGSYQKEGFRKSLSVEDVCPRVQLPSSWDEFLAGMSQKDRHEIRRKANRIRREAEGYRYFVTTRVSFSEDIESFLELHRKSDVEKMAFMNLKKETFFREMAWILLEEGWLELSFLEVNGSKLSGLLNFRYGDTAYLYNSGYDPEFGRWSPGWVLISHSIQDAIEWGFKNYDFMRGNEPYKYRFGARDFEIYRVTIQRREEHLH